MKTLGAYMIVKNEESCIATCLRSIINICDEIVIIDTGCNDKTMDIVKSFNSPKIKTSYFKWINDFSAARNYAKSLTKSDYVFTTDADEEFTDGLQKYILELKENDFENYDAIELWLLNKNKDGQDTTYLGGRTIIKNSPSAKWMYKIHEKLYNKEDYVLYTPFEVGHIIHSHKSGGSTDAYSKYAEIYFNELNAGDSNIRNNKAHFFYYLFFTLNGIDEFTAKTNLTGLFEPNNIIATSEDQRVSLLNDNYLTPQQFYALSTHKNIDPKLVHDFISKYPDDIAEYIFLKTAYEKVILDKKHEYKDYVIPQFGLLSYNNGMIMDFINITNMHAKLSPTNKLAISNLEFIYNFIKPFHAKYKLAIDCRQSTEHLPSLVYYLSQYFYDAYFIVNQNQNLDNYNLNPFRNSYFVETTDDIQGDILIFDASKAPKKDELIDILNKLICGVQSENTDLFTLKKNPFKIKVALCVLCRRENKFLREYVNYYKNIGFDKIFVYDNNQPNDNQKAIDVLGDIINDGVVEIVDWPINQRYITQVEAYQTCYDKENQNYDWIAFFDCDEYLMIDRDLNIKDFLQQNCFDGYGSVLFTNTDYSDSDMIENNTCERLSIFNKESRFSRYHWYKQILRNKMNVDFFSPQDGHHIAKTGHKKCDADGVEIKKILDIWAKKPTRNAYIKHIPTGAFADFVNFKCDGINMPDEYYIKKLDYYLRYNTLSVDKFKYWFENKEKRAR